MVTSCCAIRPRTHTPLLSGSACLAIAKSSTNTTTDANTACICSKPLHHHHIPSCHHKSNQSANPSQKVLNLYNSQTSWNNVPDATGYYMVLSKKNGEAYQPVSGFENRLKKLTGLDLYAVMEANGEGDYKVDFFAFNTSPTIRVSNEVSIEITFTNCEHSYTKEIQESYYRHSESISCTSKTEYYYACEYCGEMAPKEEQYIYEMSLIMHANCIMLI